MIDYLDIEGWEGYSQGHLDFDQGVNVILGLTDSGKSAILRALMAVSFNRPAGIDLINDKFKRYRIELGTLDDWKIARTRNRSDKNTYELDDNVYRSFGHSPPEDIAKALNLSRDLNVQAQIDPIFLIQSSPGEVARHFNDVAGLDKIDKSMSYLRSKERSKKADLSRHQDRVKDLEQQLERYTGLDELEGEISELEQTESQIKSLRSQRDLIQRQVNRISQAQEKIDQLSQLTDLKPLVEESLSLIDQIEQKKQKRSDWKRLVDKVKRAEKSATTARKELARLESRWHEEAPDVCPLCGEGRLK